LRRDRCFSFGNRISGGSRSKGTGKIHFFRYVKRIGGPVLIGYFTDIAAGIVQESLLPGMNDQRFLLFSGSLQYKNKRGQNTPICFYIHLPE